MQVLEHWNDVLEGLKLCDSQYYEEYAYMYGKARMFYFSKSGRNAFIIALLNDTYNDFETPYGYGSFYTDSYDKSFMNDFFTAFENTCRDMGLIAGLIRFNPLYRLPSAPFPIDRIRSIAIADRIPQYEKYISSSCRNMISRAGKLGLEIYFTKAREDYMDFHKIYKSRMIEKNAMQDLMFDTDYFLHMYSSSLFQLCIARQNDTAVGGAVFIAKRGCMAYYHLSAVEDNSAFPGLSNLLLSEGLNMSRIMKCPCMMLGGGLTDSKDDSLLKFKMSFTDKMLDYHIGKVIIDSKEYNRRVKDYDSTHSSFRNFHLRYRYE